MFVSRNAFTANWLPRDRSDSRREAPSGARAYCRAPACGAGPWRAQDVAGSRRRSSSSSPALSERASTKRLGSRTARLLPHLATRMISSFNILWLSYSVAWISWRCKSGRGLAASQYPRRSATGERSLALRRPARSAMEFDDNSSLCALAPPVACFALAMGGSISTRAAIVTASGEGMPQWPKFPSSTPTFTCTT